MESFIVYMVNCIVFFCGLFLLFAAIEWLDNKIESIFRKKKKICRRKIMGVSNTKRESHFYNLIID